MFHHTNTQNLSEETYKEMLGCSLEILQACLMYVECNLIIIMPFFPLFFVSLTQDRRYK